MHSLIRNHPFSRTPPYATSVDTNQSFPRICCIHGSGVVAGT
jgi:hypothetical protein